MNNILTASRMLALLSCPRKHFWSYEIGLRKTEVGVALRIGSAWARAMEARWNGKTYEETLAYALPEGIDLDAHTAETVAALIAGYFEYYGELETNASLRPEVQIPRRKIGGTDFEVSGVMDVLGRMKDGRAGLIEAKTTGDSLEPDSDYWLRLRFNMQVLHYISESRYMGEGPEVVLYDVCRKPSIHPKMITDLDADGKKIVNDLEGSRVFKKNGEPRESASKKDGWIVRQHLETPEEFSARLFEDIRSRPEFYFCRREVPVIDSEVEMFERQRLEMVDLIEHYRSREFATNSAPISTSSDARDPESWPRNVSCDTCNFCQFKSFCLQNITPDLNHPPEGFSIEPFNPELK